MIHLDHYHNKHVDRAIGCFIGLAVGDALGAPLEFGPRREVEDHTEMTAGGPFSLPAGCFTDDTSMAVALGHSLIASDGLNVDAAMKRFLQWYWDGKYSATGRCFDIGNQTRKALLHYDETGKPIPADVTALGNGAIMRLAPVPVFYRQRPDYAAKYGAEQAALTHCNLLQASANAWLSFSLARQIVGHASFDTPRERADFTPGLEYLTNPEVRAAATRKWRDVPRQWITSSGHVISTLEAALWSVATTGTFEAAVVRAVNLGDDADTIGAVTGQIAGAIYGLSGIPKRWLDALLWKDELLRLAQALLRED